MTEQKKMKPSVKKKWVEALRSGEFEQGQGKLCDSSTGGYCCLGVLSELAVREGKTEKWETDNGVVFYGKQRGSNSTGFLPASVRRWAGLSAGDDDPYIHENGVDLGDLASLNDQGHTFFEIADLIEKNL